MAYNKFNNQKSKNFNQPNPVNFNAHAPYNFVSLPSKVIYPDSIMDLEFDNEGVVIKGEGLSKFSGNSGEIELVITTKSPLFIGDSKKAKDGDLEEFFSVNGEYKIPGSSIRGMVRNLVEVCSYSKFNIFNDSKFYFREMAGKSRNSLKTHYEEILVGKQDIKGGKKINISKAKAGYLQRINDREYQIIEADFERKKFQNDKRWANDKYPEMEIKRFSNKDFSSYYYEIYSGMMNGKKHFYHIKMPKKTKPIPLNYADIKNYKFDNLRQPQRGKFLNLIKELDKKLKDGGLEYPNGVPCFYTEYNGRIYFGHTPYFRVPYQKSVGDLIDSKLKDSKKLDLTEAIFGKDGVLATRVFFEDGVLQNQPKWLDKNETSVILSSPKPTSYNLYLEQNGVTNVSQIKHFDSHGAKIRGYKFYHHKNLDIDIPKELQNKPKLIKKIKPLDADNVFKAKIRFENLSDVELGALMFVLNLPQNCYHKLGMAKPLGLGKVEIKAGLKLDDLKQRYSVLFDENSEFFEPILEIDSKDFISKFESFILENSNENKKSLWEMDRLKDLEIMLKDAKKGNFSYMDLQKEFKHKDKILPKPKDLKWKSYHLSEQFQQEMIQNI